MLKKLHMSLNFSNLVIAKLLSYKVTAMRNFVAKFGKILEICKKFAENQVNEITGTRQCKKKIRLFFCIALFFS